MTRGDCEAVREISCDDGRVCLDRAFAIARLSAELSVGMFINTVVGGCVEVEASSWKPRP